MLFIYNWKAIWKYCKGDKKLILKIFRSLAIIKVPSKKEQLIINKLAKEDAKSYVVDIQNLLRQRVNDEYKLMYLYLASKRNISDYRINEIDYLDCIVIDSFIDINTLNSNPLLTIEGDKILFKY